MPARKPGPARALTIHLLRMLETRMDAAGIALNSEIQTFSLRLQLKLLAAGALFVAIWGAIVLLAIVLPDPYRGPVLGGVVAAVRRGRHLGALRRETRDFVSCGGFPALVPGRSKARPRSAVPQPGAPRAGRGTAEHSQ